MDVDSKTGRSETGGSETVSISAASFYILYSTSDSENPAPGLDACFPVAGGTTTGSSRSIESTTACSVVAIYA